MSLLAPQSAPTHARPARRPPESPRRPNPAWAIAAATVLAALFAARVLVVIGHDSITSDESTHLGHSLHFWATGDDLGIWALGTARLPHILAGGASYLALDLAGLMPEAGEGLAGRIRALVLSGEPRVLIPARLTGLLWGLGLLAVVAWGVGRRRGLAAGLVAAALLSMVPEVLAHSAIAGSDLPFAASAMLFAALLARYAEGPTRGRWIAVAMAAGLAWSVRHTAVLLVASAVVARGIVAIRGARADGRWARALAECSASCAGMAAIAAALLWAGDGLATVTPAALAARSEHVAIPQRIGPIDISKVPIPTSLISVAMQVRHQGQGHQAYFLGERREHGWPLYFPVAFALKTPIGLLGLLAIAAARSRPRSWGAWEWTCAGLLGLLGFSLIRGHVNIGVRYALLAYPLAMPFQARLFEPAALRDRLWGPLAIALAVLFAGESLSAHPRYLSWFNATGGGPSRGWLYLADSNIDWGQDLDGLADACGRLGIAEVTTDISSDRTLSAPGLAVHRFASLEGQVLDDPSTPPGRRLPGASGSYLSVPTRYMAVSTSRLMGLYGQNDLNWLRTRRLAARVGDSIFLFDLDGPAERPLGL
ncbi:MAG: glycosyltransferase family 39 protein [Isosphaeraceae bacterium]